MRERLKVLFVTQLMASQQHGPSRKAVLLAEAHAQQTAPEIDLRFLTEEPLEQRSEDYRITMNTRRAKSRLAKYYRSHAYHQKLRDIYKLWQFDVVCFNDAQKAIVSAMRGLPGQARLIAFINDDNSADTHRRSYDHFSRYVYRRLQRIVEAYVAKRAHRVIACSRYLSEVLAKAYKLPTLPAVLHPSIKPTEYEALGLARAEADLLYVKSDPHRGGLSSLLSALAHPQLTSRIGTIHIAGFAESVFEKDFRMLIPPKVAYKFHGRLSRDELAQLAQSTAIGVVPSLHEAFGITAVEYVAAGLQVIIARAGGLPEAVQNLPHLSFERGNTQQLAEQIHKALHLPRCSAPATISYTYLDMYKRWVELLVQVRALPE